MKTRRLSNGPKVAKLPMKTRVAIGNAFTALSDTSKHVFNFVPFIGVSASTSRFHEQERFPSRTDQRFPLPLPGLNQETFWWQQDKPDNALKSINNLASQRISLIMKVLRLQH